MEGFRITNAYRYLLYLASILLVFSLFFEIKGFDSIEIVENSKNIIILGIGMWFFDVNLFTNKKLLLFIKKREYDVLILVMAFFKYLALITVLCIMVWELHSMFATPLAV